MNDENYSMSGRVVVISGAAGLLGKNHADAVARKGATPILLDINRLAAASRALSCLLASISKLDLLVNNRLALASSSCLFILSSFNCFLAFSERG